MLPLTALRQLIPLQSKQELAVSSFLCKIGHDSFLPNRLCFPAAAGFLGTALAGELWLARNSRQQACFVWEACLLFSCPISLLPPPSLQLCTLYKICRLQLPILWESESILPYSGIGMDSETSKTSLSPSLMPSLGTFTMHVKISPGALTRSGVHFASFIALLRCFLPLLFCDLLSLLLITVRLNCLRLL